MDKGSLKVLDQTLAAFHPSIRALNEPSSHDHDESDLSLSGFFGFDWLGCELEPDLGHVSRLSINGLLRTFGEVLE